MLKALKEEHHNDPEGGKPSHIVGELRKLFELGSTADWRSFIRQLAGVKDSDKADAAAKKMVSALALACEDHVKALQSKL